MEKLPLSSKSSGRGSLLISSGSLTEALPCRVKVPFLLEKSSRIFFERLRELNVFTTVMSDRSRLLCDLRAFPGDELLSVHRELIAEPGKGDLGSGFICQLRW